MASPPLVLHVTSRDESGIRVGFAVGRNVGPAVVRNRVRRQLRHLVRSRLDSIPDATALVVRALPGAAGSSSAELAAAFERGVARGIGQRRSPASGSAPA